MLRGQDIIYFSNDWNADNRTSSRHIAGQLSKYNRLLYVESSGLRAPKNTAHDIKRIIRKIKRFLQGSRLVENNVYRYAPLLLPYHKYRFIRELNRLILVYFLKRICRKLKFNSPVLWIIIPHMAPLIRNFNEKLVVYYCVDDFASLPGVESSIVANFDRQLTEKADVIFTPSESLYMKKKEINKNTYVSPHGVDVRHFSKIFDNTLVVPEDMKCVKKPILGFFGLIENWVDLNLIAYLAEYNPHWSIVMIGRIAQNITSLKKVKNVYFLGARKYELLPNYAQCFDVALIPYVLNGQVMNANPIKLREYLAMGKAVVSVRTPEIEKFADVVKVSDGYKSFARNVEIALKENSGEQIEIRRKRVKDSSWENCFERISANINLVLNQRTNRDASNVVKKNYISKYGVANDAQVTIQRQLKSGEEKLKSAPPFLKEIMSTYSKDSKLLDVGCGVGSDLRVLRENGYNNLCGIDIIFDAVKNAKQLGLKKVAQANCEKLPFKRGYFDLCIAHNIIEHILNPLKFLNEIHRILKPNGVVYLTVPRAASLDDRMLRWGGLILHGRTSHIQKFNFEKLRALFKKTNFLIKKGQEKRGAELNFPALDKIPCFFIIAKLLRLIFKLELTGWSFQLKRT